MRGRKLCCLFLIVIFLAATGLVVTEILLLKSFSFSQPHIIKDVATTLPLCSDGSNAVGVNKTCKPCSEFEKNLYQNACSQSGYIQLLACKNDKLEPSSCPQSDEEMQKRFWIFEIVVLVGALSSGFVAFKRQQHLERQAARKLDRRLMQNQDQHSVAHHHEQLQMDTIATSSTPLLSSTTNSAYKDDEDETNFTR